ncbi:uncharacterized protein LOC101240655 isoform X2 [Hydra vulgaris]|uniref:Uncharacterized protein LOC101240655 isoform X2 n=1 Tax=Hydra vulgaris TaxID=6087 RepID=A0ABM4BHF7_HYDVU
MVPTTTDSMKFKNGGQIGIPSREFHVHYAAVSENAVQETSSAQIIYVYCSPRMKHTLSLLWKLILLSYVVAVPLFIYFLQKDCEENTAILFRLENNYANYIKYTEKDSSKRVRREIASNNSLEIGLKIFKETYNTKPINDVEKSISNQISTFQKKLEVYATRMENVKAAEEWVNRIYRMYSNKTSLACDCNGKKFVENCVNVNYTEKSQVMEQSVKGPRGPKGDKGEKGEPGPSGAPGHSINCAPIKSNSIIYIKWGSKECNQNATLLYNGYISGAVSTQKGDGSNYLCLPQQPSYRNVNSSNLSKNNNNKKESNKFAQITGITHLNGKQIDCSVCERYSKNNVLMIPAETKCPVGWLTEYKGMLKTRLNSRTEYICVYGETNEDNGQLRYVEVSNCNFLKCEGQGYQNNVPLSCVVCTK